VIGATNEEALLVKAARESLLLAARDALTAERAASAGDLRVAECLIFEMGERLVEARALLDAAGGARLVPVRTTEGIVWVEENAPIVQIQKEASTAINALVARAA
jgi:hypothetical protein